MPQRHPRRTYTGTSERATSAPSLGVYIQLECQIGEFGRGERDSPFETQQSVRFLLINQTPPRGAAEQTA